MDDRKKTVIAVYLLIALVFLLVGSMLMFFFGPKPKVVAPIPEEGAIQIIFLTPTPEVSNTPTAQPSATKAPARPQATNTRSPGKPTATPSPVKSASSSATPKP